MRERDIIMENQIITVIDRLKGLCHSCGLSNQAAEEDIVTTVFLYKYLSDQYREKVILEARKTGKTISEILRSDFTTDIKLRPADLIDCLIKNKDNENIADYFDQTLVRIASYKENKKYEDSLGEPLFHPITKSMEKRNDFIRQVLTLMEGTDFARDKVDYFAQIFEYLIKDYNVASGKYAEYYTPSQISSIIARLLVKGNKDPEAKVYDPSAGSGSLLLHLAQELGTNAIYSQDISLKSTRLLRINMLLNGHADSVKNIRRGDTLTSPEHIDQKFDYIVSNPPFKVDFSFTRDEIAEKWSGCFCDGVPEIPKKKKDAMAIYLCFIQHVIWSLKENGRAAIVVPAGFLSIKGGIEENIRKRLVVNGWLEGIVLMPRNVFANTATRVAVLFIDRSQWNQGVTLMDASELGKSEKIGKVKKTILSDDDIACILEGYLKKDGPLVTTPKLSEIADNNYSLIPGQYAEIEKYQKHISDEEFDQKTAEVFQSYCTLCRAEKEIDLMVQTMFRKLGNRDEILSGSFCEEAPDISITKREE